MSDCCLMPTQQFSAISWREQDKFQWDDDEVCFVLDQHAQSDCYIVSSLKQQSKNRHVCPTRTHYPDSEPTDNIQNKTVHTNYNKSQKGKGCVLFLWYNTNLYLSHVLYVFFRLEVEKVIFQDHLSENIRLKFQIQERFCLHRYVWLYKLMKK